MAFPLTHQMEMTQQRDYWTIEYQELGQSTQENHKIDTRKSFQTRNLIIEK